MAKQLVLIHGGHARNSHEDYLRMLIERVATIEDFKRKRGWKDALADELEPEWEVFAPSMPCKWNAKYAEWKLWFEKLIPFLTDDVILVGHSLGGIFLAKFLSEEQFPKRIRATVLVAAPYNTLTEHPRADFNITEPFDELVRQGGDIYLYHSPDDMIVPFSAFQRYRRELPTAHAVVLEERGHFLQEEFPELIEELKKL